MSKYNKVILFKLGTIEQFTFGNGSSSQSTDFYTNNAFDCSNVFTQTSCTDIETSVFHHCTNGNNPLPVGNGLYLVTESDDFRRCRN